VSTPATYREYAADCLTAMRAAMLPEVRALLLAMAQRWNESAERAEKRASAPSANTECELLHIQRPPSLHYYQASQNNDVDGNLTPFCPFL
jgi:hypothetical protein